MLELSPSEPLLVFGGPYSNLRATEALIDEADRLGIPASNIICTGDVVAYCAEPEETAQRIAAWGCLVIQGNCEQQLADDAPDCACNFEAGSACELLAKGWYPFARERVSQSMRTWMGSLPATIRFKIGTRSFQVVHGGVTSVNRWVFASDKATLRQECGATDSDVIIAGHAGLPFVARSATTTWFNPGVIGMPANDGTADVWYGLVAPDADGGLTLSTHRLAYDHVGASAAMRRYGYANGYARSLVTGLWPSQDILPETERAHSGKRIRPRGLSLTSRTAARTPATAAATSANAK